MRTGKRWLAGVAAGALGAGMISFVAATPAAQAASSPATILFAYPSATIVGTNLKVDESGINMPVYVLDSAGDSVTDLTGYSVEVTATDPTTVSNDDSMVVGFGAFAGAATKKSTTTLNAYLATTIWPASNGMTWDTVSQNAPGTYTLTARLYVTGSGAVVSTASIPVSVVQATATPTITFNWLNNSKLNTTWWAGSQSNGNANVINRLGGSVGADVARTLNGYDPPTIPGSSSQDDTAAFYIWPSNATGGPVFLPDDSISISMPSSGTSGNFSNLMLQSGFASRDGTISIGDTDTTWSSTSSSRVLTATYTPGGGASNQSGTLAAQVGQADGVSSAPDVDLTTANFPGYLYGEAYDYAVKPGTTSLSFDVSMADALGIGDDSFIMYNAQSSEYGASGGVVTNSGGRIAIRNDAGTLTLTLNAKAAAADETLTLYTGKFGTGATNVMTTIVVAFRSPTALLDATPGLGKISTALPVPGTITDQYGATLPGTWAITMKDGQNAGQSAATIASATAAADGSFVITVPAAYARTTAGTKYVTLWASNGFTSTSYSPELTYTTTGGLTSLTATTLISTGATSALPVVKTPPDGIVNTTTLTSQTNATAATTLTASTISAAGTAFESQVKTNPAGVYVTWSGSAGVFFTNKLDGSILYSQGTSTFTRYANDTTTVAVFATKPGTHTVTITAGETTTSFQFKAGVARGSGRTLEATTAVALAPESFVTTKATIKDIYGNPVPDDTGVTVTLLGGGTLSPTSGSRTAASNAAGEVFAYYTAPAGSGKAQIQWSADNFQTGTIAGAPALKYVALTDIEVGSAPSTKSIVIVGERGTVSGKPGIIVDGTTKGFESGKTVIPYVRFPGGQYTQGTARPKISAVGDFEWSRKTGKKSYVYFTSDDGAVASNRIIIAAS